MAIEESVPNGVEWDRKKGCQGIHALSLGCIVENEFFYFKENP